MKGNRRRRVLRHMASWVAAAALALSACEADRALPGAEASLDALGRTVWKALVAGDTAALAAVRLSEHEHNDLVWPELPASRPEVNYPVDMAWDNIQRRNRRATNRLLAAFRGSNAELRSVECRGDDRVFQTFRVRQDCYLVLQDPRHGSFHVQAFRYVHVMNGGHKIFRYYDD